MKFRISLGVFAGLCCLVGSAAAQTRTVTNADLAKFREKRLQAEKELDEHYAKMGLTRADVERRDAEDAKEREELALKLRAARLERERVEYEARAREAAAAAARRQEVVIAPEPYYSGLGGYIFYGNRWISTPIWGLRRHNDGIRWRATPMGVVYEPGSRPSTIWSPPFGGRPRPLRGPH